MNVPTIRTKYLALIPLLPGNEEVLHHIYQTDGVLRYFPIQTPPPLEKVERFIASKLEHWKKFGYGNWVIFPNGRAAKEIIGWAGL
jgi:hypothetical protein